MWKGLQNRVYSQTLFALLKSKMSFKLNYQNMSFVIAFQNDPLNLTPPTTRMTLFVGPFQIRPLQTLFI